MSEVELVHGTAVSLGAKAVLIRGPSGSGKSDLALRCIAAAPLPQGSLRAELVADDQVRLVRQGGFVVVSAPAAIAGRMEVRGLGILAVPYRLAARLALIADIVPAADVPRFPLEDRHATFAGVEVPILHLAAFESSAPVKLLLALDRAL
ncbi:MAG: HPr kinase/phosphorylase [Hyphomicrobium sp.]|uniref:HPr kinase/phosphorylase n=1 Tax=Hyphomicrobium sp. TaxID=82 RepID=UPI003D10208F